MSEDRSDVKKEDDSETMLVKFNIEQVLKLISFLCPNNSEMPGFILKMYMVWHSNTMNNLVSAPTIIPKEDFDKFRKMYKNQLVVVADYLEKLFFRMELRESIKQASEKAGEKR